MKRLDNVMARWAAMMLAWVAGAAFAADWQNSLRSVSTHTGEANSLVIQVEMEKPVGRLPESFSVDSPARLLVDFPATANALAQSSIEVNQGGLRNLEVVQGEDRSRMILNLTQAAPFSTKVEGNRYIVTLRNPLANPAAPVSRIDAASASGMKHALRDVDFRRGKNGEGRIQIDLSDDAIGVDVRRQGRNLIVDFKDARLPANLQHKLDVVDFGTPVQMVDTFSQGGDVRMVIEPKGQWEFSSYQTDQRLVVEVKPVVDDPNKLAKAGGYTGEKLSLNFQNVSVREALAVIADFTNMNIVISDSVTGNVTLRLKEVPWDQALDIIMQSRGLDMRRHGSVVQIAPREELAAKEKAALTAQQEISDLESLHTESIQLNYQQADAVAGILSNEKQRILSKRGSAVVDGRTNTIFVQDTAGQLEAVRKLIKQIDVPVRQVMIEARVVEALDKFSRNLGARLTTSMGPNGFGVGNMRGTIGAGGVPGTTVTVGGVNTGLASSNVNLPVTPNPGGAFSFILANALGTKFIGLELTASETDGVSRIISSPRVVTADQKEAIIEQGTEIPYQTISAVGAPPTIAFKKAALQLKVKPQITPDENVIMNVTIHKDTVGTLYVQGVPTVDTNKVETQVLVENGGTVVIGGVHTQIQKNNINKVPVLGDVPVLGNLFRNTLRQDDKGELLIFLSPKILKETLGLH